MNIGKNTGITLGFGIALAASWFVWSFYQASIQMEVKQQHPTDFTVRVAVTPQNKQDIVRVLDRVTSARGWVKTPAAPGLNDMFKREVLFFSYGRSSRDMLITITDIKNISELELSAFFEESEPGLVEGIVDEFIADVRAIPSVSSVIEEPRDSKHAL